MPSSSPDSTALHKLQRFILLVEDGLLVFLLTSMIVLASAQILLRNFFDAGLSWGDPALRLLVLWIALLGAMAATRDNNHISIDILSHFLSARNRARVKRVTDLFAGIVCGFIAWHAVTLVLMEKQDGAIAFASFPTWIGESIIPIGFGIMALRFFLHSLLGTGNK
ncbi:MAG: TRAP transporter small permease [Chromatiales bacterium]